MFARFFRVCKREPILVNDPIFSREAVQEYATHPEKKLNRYKKIGNFATQSTIEVFMKCPLCDDKHDLDECKSFKEKGLQERSSLLFEHKLRYGCFSPISANHNARNCKERKECKFFRKKRPTSLHGSKTEKPNEQKNFCCATVSMSLEVISM